MITDYQIAVGFGILLAFMCILKIDGVSLMSIMALIVPVYYTRRSITEIQLVWICALLGFAVCAPKIGWAVVVIVVLCAAALVYAPPKQIVVPFLNWCGVWCFNMHKKAVYLSIDDVPGPEGATGTILDVLKKHKVKATLFVIASYGNKDNRDVMKRAIRDGHLLANHGARDRAHAFLSTDELAKEITDCQKYIDGLYKELRLPAPPRFYRPASGFFTSSMLALCTRMNYKMVLATVYPHDGVIQCTWINQMYLSARAEMGDIVVVHDRARTPALLDEWLPAALKSGLSFDVLPNPID